MVENSVFQFKITLQGIKPTIWRRIQISAKCTFWDLHVALQDAMGWTDSHLHEFRVVNPTTSQKENVGIPDGHGEDVNPMLAGWEIKVKDYMEQKKNRNYSRPRWASSPVGSSFELFFY